MKCNPILNELGYNYSPNRLKLKKKVGNLSSKASVPMHLIKNVDQGIYLTTRG